MCARHALRPRRTACHPSQYRWHLPSACFLMHRIGFRYPRFRISRASGQNVSLRGSITSRFRITALLLGAGSLLTLPPVHLRSTRTLHRVCWSLLQQGHPPLQVAPLLKPNLTASAPRRMYRRRLPLPGWDFHPAVLIAPNWRTHL